MLGVECGTYCRPCLFFDNLLACNLVGSSGRRPSGCAHFWPLLPRALDCHHFQDCCRNWWMATVFLSLYVSTGLLNLSSISSLTYSWVPSCINFYPDLYFHSWQTAAQLISVTPSYVTDSPWNTESCLRVGMVTTKPIAKVTTDMEVSPLGKLSFRLWTIQSEVHSLLSYFKYKTMQSIHQLAQAQMIRQNMNHR